MLTHAQIWRMIDWLAARNGLSASGLARRAGLDPTTFNPSKRGVSEGRQRWPSTESIAKALAATGTTFVEFAGSALAMEADAPRPGAGVTDPDGTPHVVSVPPSATGLLLRPESRLIVVATADVSIGDRVLLHLDGGESLVGETTYVDDTAIGVALANGSAESRLARTRIASMKRILWISP